MASAYTLPSANVLPGNWTELYVGGGPGQEGNSLNALSIAVPDGLSSPPLMTWTLDGMSLDEVTGSRLFNYYDENDYITEYTTRYTGGSLTVYNVTNPDTLVVNPAITSGNLVAYVLAYIGYDNGEYYYAWGDIHMTGSNGLIMNGNLWETGANDAGHWGTIGINSLSIEDPSGPVVPTPEPAILLLLGCGLAGLAGIRRKFKG